MVRDPKKAARVAGRRMNDLTAAVAVAPVAAAAAPLGRRAPAALAMALALAVPSAGAATLEDGRAGWRTPGLDGGVLTVAQSGARVTGAAVRRAVPARAAGAAAAASAVSTGATGAATGRPLLQDVSPESGLPPPPAPAAAPLWQPRPDALALAEVLGRALADDPGVRGAGLLREAADARRKAAGARYAPTLGVNVLRGQARDEESGTDVARRNQRIDASLRLNVYNAGNDARELEASRREVGAADADVRRSREEGAERIAEAYLDLLRLEQLTPHALRRLDDVQRLVALVGRQNTLGKASDIDLQQARASQVDAEIALDQLEAERAGARQKLMRLTGFDVPGVQPTLLPPPAGGDIAQPTGQIAAAQARAEAAQARVPSAASLLAPRVDLELRQRLSDRTTPAPTTIEQHAWALTARWDVSLGGESLYRRDESRLRAEAAQAEAERLQRVNRAELEALVPRLEQSERAVARLRLQVQQYGGLVRAGELQFEAGRRSLSQLIGLQDGLYAIQQRLAEQTYRWQQAQLRRLALTGQLLPTLATGETTLR
ncbi:MAG: hypothetical protein RL223_2633 [Pseudomonadota bacterium]